MIDEAKQDLLVQYLLGELDPTTADEVRAEIAHDVELRDFARDLEETFASLAHTASPMAPPRELPQRILQTERRTRRGSPPAPYSKIIWLTMPWALAACFAIVCAVLSLEQARIRKDLVSLQEQNQEASKALISLQEQNQEASKALVTLQEKIAQSERELAALKEKNVLAELKIATLKAQIAAYKGATAVVVWDKEQKNGVLQLDKLPPPPQGKDYQLWVIDPKNPQPVSAGILSVPTDGLIRTSFHPAAPIESADAFAISVEKKGGAAKPEGQIILVGK
jgi:anti-sigma-K factor RskA